MYVEPDAGLFLRMYVKRVQLYIRRRLWVVVSEDVSMRERSR